MLWSFLKNRMLNNLDRKICESSAEMTFDDAVIFAEGFAKELRGTECCAILCNSEMAAGIALLSCFAAGVTAVPLSYRYGRAHCEKILKLIGPDAIITDNSGEIEVVHIEDPEYTEPKEHPALIMCTSGTTGTPKGAMLTEKNIVTNVSDIAAYFNIQRGDTILIARPLYHCAVLTGEFLTALTKGADIRFYSGAFDPAAMLKLIDMYKVTAFCGTPTLLRMMARLKKDCGSLRHISVSGECMSKEVGRQIAEAFKSSEVYHIYGLTEACPRVSYLPPNKFSEYPDFVGVPLKSVSLKIINKDGEKVKTGEVGALWIKGDNIMAGYYNAPEKTSEVLKNGWLCTGDLAVQNASGFLKIMGRSDDLIIKAGMNIYPQEIEGTLKRDKRVKEVLASGSRDDALGTAIILTIAGDFKDTAEVRKLCKEMLPSYALPSKIHLVDSIPKNGSGKIIRRKQND